MVLRITERLLDSGPPVLTVVGRLDAVAAPELKRHLKGLVAEGYQRIVVDLSGVPFIDSSGLAALVSGLKAAREAGGTILLASLDGQARTVFTVTLLDRVFEFYSDVDSAVKALNRGG